MSLLVANVVPEGLIFAADRNLSDPKGSVVGTAPKVMKWQDPPLLLGYVGNATVIGEPMHEWLHRFLKRHATENLGDLAHRLADELEAASQGLTRSERGTILHLGAFEETHDRPLPAIWYVRDAEIQPDGSVKFLGEFQPRDELKVEDEGPPYFGDATGDEIRSFLRGMPTPLPWVGFRQSFDLAVFGHLDPYLWAFESALVLGNVARRAKHSPPTTLAEWVPFMKMSVLCYAAYFEAFYPPGKQLVGGGVDVEHIAWPE